MNKTASLLAAALVAVMSGPALAGAPVAAASHAPERPQISGTIASVESRRVVLRAEDGRRVTLAYDAGRYEVATRRAGVAHAEGNLGNEPPAGAPRMGRDDVLPPVSRASVVVAIGMTMAGAAGAITIARGRPAI